AGAISHSVARFDWASQTYQPFVAPNSGGLADAYGITVGPDGNVYVTDGQNRVLRYDGATGAPLPAPGQSGATYVASGSGGLSASSGLTFGADGSLYVVSTSTNQILRYQGPTGSSPGAFKDVFVSVTSGVAAQELTFRPDGNLYVSVYDADTSKGYAQVNRYDGVTGAPVGDGIFVPLGSGGFANRRALLFDPQGLSLYAIGDTVQQAGQVFHFQGPFGQNPGAFVE